MAAAAKAKRRRKQQRVEARAAARALLDQYGGDPKDTNPVSAAVVAGLRQIVTTHWDQPDRIRKIEILIDLPGAVQSRGDFRPDPNADVRALHRYLSRLADAFAATDKELKKQQRNVGINVSDRPIGEPMRLLLGLTRATANTLAKERRRLAASARGVSAETLRTSHEQPLCAVIAGEIVRQELRPIRRGGYQASLHG